MERGSVQFSEVTSSVFLYCQVAYSCLYDFRFQLFQRASIHRTRYQRQQKRTVNHTERQTRRKKRIALGKHAALDAQRDELCEVFKQLLNAPSARAVVVRRAFRLRTPQQAEDVRVPAGEA